MIDLYFSATPNGYKPLVALEELGLPYRVRPVDMAKGEQFAPDFLAISPNNRIPAIVDHAPADGGAPLPLFESGAILDYLANKAGGLQPATARARAEVQQWLFWQVGGIGPNMGQLGHFLLFATEDVPYARARFTAETGRLFGVMERRLADRDYLAGAYSIADIASYPWIKVHALAKIPLDAYPRLRAWTDAIAARPAVQRAYAAGAAAMADPLAGQPGHS